MKSKEMNRLKQVFEKAKADNLPESSITLWDGRIFYGRVIRRKENNITLIGMKNKHIHIYTGEQNGSHTTAR